MKISADIVFNCIVFIESLEDSITTKDIYNHVNYFSNNLSIGRLYYTVNNEGDLMQLLNHLLEDPDTIPLLHFATHGNSDGMVLKNGMSSWDVLTPIIQKLNVKCKNQLLVVMALCFGGHLLNCSTVDFQRSPFGLMIGPKSSINWYELDQNLMGFYVDAIKYGVDTALTNLNNRYEGREFPFYIQTSHGILRSIILKLHSEIKDSRTRHFIMDAYKRNHGFKMPFDLKNTLLDEEGIMNIYRENFKSFTEKYLLIDIYPELRENFIVNDYDDYLKGNL